MTPSRPTAALLAALLWTPCLAPNVSAGGGFDPPNGDWGKTAGTDLRLMTYNIQDNICSTTTKTEGFNSWTALARSIAAMKPDVLILQEVGDNTGNGTGSGVDGVGTLQTTLELFMHGGTDPFNGGTVTAFVQAYDPAYDLPHIYVSSRTDGFNRNVIMSRYPFADLNGDTRSTYLDTPIIQADQYATGSNGGIRGFTHAEIDLPDDVYEGDLVIGNSHLKSGGSSSDRAQRVDAAQNIAYYIDYLYQGAGTGTIDPNNKIGDNPQATSLLGPNTVVVLGGDWNEDEQNNGATKGPAEWITCAQFCSTGTDGTDRDRTDMTYDDAREPFTNGRTTLGSSKLDYFAWQDSIATERRSFIFRSDVVPAAARPAEITGFPINPGSVTSVASDHRPVITDLIVPVPMGPSGPFCFGSGCPCGNDDPLGGCVNSTGAGSYLSPTAGSFSVSADDLELTATGLPPGNSGLYFMGASIFAPVFVGDGLGCTGGLFRFAPGLVTAGGEFFLNSPVAGAPPGQITPGDTRHFQAWTRDVLCGPPPSPCPSPCGNNSALSSGYSITFTP